MYRVGKQIDNSELPHDTNVRQQESIIKKTRNEENHHDISSFGNFNQFD